MLGSRHTPSEGASGATTTAYRKTLPNGDVLRTKASHGNDAIGDPTLVAHIMRDQLRVTPAQFWDAVDRGNAPAREKAEQSAAPAGAPAHNLPEWLAVRLAVQVGLSDEEIAGLDEEAALARWDDWCSRPMT